MYEWCYDWRAEYSGGSETDPTGPASTPEPDEYGNGPFRVYRGGDWWVGVLGLLCAARNGAEPNLNVVDNGFRLCRTAN